MHRMNALDAGMFFAENDTTPLQIGSVTVFEGPAPHYPDLVRQVPARLPFAPRRLQRVRTVPLNFAHPVWVGDQHFAIEHHVRHTALPAPGGAHELHEMAARVLGRRLDLTRAPWELWLVDGLEGGRWAAITKVHHCMVEGIAGIDLLTVLLDADETWSPAEPGYALRLAGAGAPTLNGPTVPRRRWCRERSGMDEIDRIRRAHGGSVNDVALAAVSRGFRALPASRGVLTEDSTVRALVPVSVRTPGERGQLSNRVSAALVDLPCGQDDPVRRLQLVREQMDGVKGGGRAAGPDALVRLIGGVPALLAVTAHTALRLRQPLVQTIVTNIPGPPFPLYAMGHRMVELAPYIPIVAGLRISIGVVSYDGALTFGLTGDHDAVRDLEVVSGGIRAGIDELLAKSPPVITVA
ncbi:MAG TPA: wax ester/triacylglycerol synthase domain-containing protein [Spirillospora sp.]|nr:wax ester/triacylglycerol synthase domain-containing protein [Spirillospora sp.]